MKSSLVSCHTTPYKALALLQEMKLNLPEGKMADSFIMLRDFLSHPLGQAPGSGSSAKSPVSGDFQ